MSDGHPTPRTTLGNEGSGEESFIAADLPEPQDAKPVPPGAFSSLSGEGTLDDVRAANARLTICVNCDWLNE